MEVPLREHLEAMIAERDKALALQAHEYARRLEILNHAHERMLALQNTFLSRERFDQYNTEHGKWGQQQTDEIDEKFNVIDLWRAEERGARTRQAAIVSFVFGVLIILIKFLPQGFGLVPQ